MAKVKIKRSNGLVPAGAVTSGAPRPLLPAAPPQKRGMAQDAAGFNPRYTRIIASIGITRQPAE